MLALKVLSVRVSGGRAALDLMVYIVPRRFYLIFILQGFVLVFYGFKCFYEFHYAFNGFDNVRDGVCFVSNVFVLVLIVFIVLIIFESVFIVLIVFSCFMCCFIWICYCLVVVAMVSRVLMFSISFGLVLILLVVLVWVLTCVVVL